MGDSTSEEIALEVISLLEAAKLQIEQLREKSGEKGNGWNARALSVSLTELETAQLWLANARPE